MFVVWRDVFGRVDYSPPFEQEEKESSRSNKSKAKERDDKILNLPTGPPFDSEHHDRGIDILAFNHNPFLSRESPEDYKIFSKHYNSMPRARKDFYKMDFTVPRLVPILLRYKNTSATDVESLISHERKEDLSKEVRVEVNPVETQPA